MNLWAPDSYKAADDETRTRYCNGCGSSGWKFDLAPWAMAISGFNPRPACLIHDWMYSEGITLDDKNKADRVFLNNMLRIIDAQGGWRWLRAWRRRLAFAFYQAVAEFGGPAFWDGEKLPTIIVAAKVG